ncbi:hypothetical protein PIB30_074934 [Stylosanthes scabra]|uniref:Tetraspanin-8-like n=1 Tax=Stylosanthes scabra TaxID=79078 RepID=A0ABU6SRF1_9FABA|nr:hypothetical protein [Stylosanthes scabra]
MLFSIPILLTAIWMSKQGNNNHYCLQLFQQPFIILGSLLLAVSVIGFIGSCCRIRWLMALYLIIMSILIIIVLSYTIFAFDVVTSKGAHDDESLSAVGNSSYSALLQNMINDNERWNKIKRCLQSKNVCSINKWNFLIGETGLYNEKLSPIQAGCCKPPNECNFIYGSPNIWNKPQNVSYSNPDCDAWSNESEVLCFNCNSCKAGKYSQEKGK